MVYPDMEKPTVVFGPTVDLLKVFCWEVRCPPKIKHLWQLVWGCISVKKNLQARGIQEDLCCARCGAPEESINHVFFACPPTRQVWALSQIPSNPAISPLDHSSQIRTTYFGEFNQKWTNINFHGFYSTFKKKGVTRFLLI